MVMLFAITAVLAFFAPNESTLGSAYKLLYLHLPLLYVSLISLVLCAAFSVHALKEKKSYPRAVKAALLGLVFGAATLAAIAAFAF